MFMTGFADEAADSIDLQIKATKELGWKNIEARGMFQAHNIASITDAEFEELYEKLNVSGVSINCYGSGIANWSKPITEPPDSSYEELLKAVPRLQKLGTKCVRVMSFNVKPELKLHSWDYEDEVIRRMEHLVEIAEDNGLLLLHENCNNWGGLSYEHTLRMMDRIQSPAFKLVFDTGNPVFNDDIRGMAPYQKQSSWEFYRNVRELIAYVHIKDGRMKDGHMVFTFAGEGDGDVIRIFEDLAKNGYDGGFSIEPHMGSVFHDDSVKTSEQYRYENYVEYGRRSEAILKEIYAKYAAK